MQRPPPGIAALRPCFNAPKPYLHSRHRNSLQIPSRNNPQTSNEHSWPNRRNGTCLANLKHPQVDNSLSSTNCLKQQSRHCPMLRFDSNFGCFAMPKWRPNCSKLRHGLSPEKLPLFSVEPDLKPEPGPAPPFRVNSRCPSL